MRRRIILGIAVVAFGVFISLWSRSSKSEGDEARSLFQDFETVAHERIGPREAWILRAPVEPAIARARLVRFVSRSTGWQLPLGTGPRELVAFFDPSLGHRQTWRAYVPYSVIPELGRYVSVSVNSGFLVQDPTVPFRSGPWTSVRILASTTKASRLSPIPLSGWRYLLKETKRR